MKHKMARAHPDNSAEDDLKRGYSHLFFLALAWRPKWVHEPNRASRASITSFQTLFGYLGFCAFRLHWARFFWGGCSFTFHNKSPVASAVQENAVLLRSSGKVSPATKLHLTFHQRDAAWTITDFIFFFAF